jgi:hypothetical protein
MCRRPQTLFLLTVAEVAAQIMGETVLPWESPAEADRRKLGTMLSPIMALLSRNPGDRPSMIEVVSSCTSLLAADNIFVGSELGSLQSPGQVLEDSDDQGSVATTNVMDQDKCGSSTDDMSGQSITRTTEWSESIPLHDELT